MNISSSMLKRELHICAIPVLQLWDLLSQKSPIKNIP